VDLEEKESAPPLAKAGLRWGNNNLLEELSYSKQVKC
jgi:hypothetical protein